MKGDHPQILTPPPWSPPMNYLPVLGVYYDGIKYILCIYTSLNRQVSQRYFLSNKLFVFRSHFINLIIIIWFNKLLPEHTVAVLGWCRMVVRFVLLTYISVYRERTSCTCIVVKFNNQLQNILYTVYSSVVFWKYIRRY